MCWGDSWVTLCFPLPFSRIPPHSRLDHLNSSISPRSLAMEHSFPSQLPGRGYASRSQHTHNVQLAPLGHDSVPSWGTLWERPFLTPEAQGPKMLSTALQQPQLSSRITARINNALGNKVKNHWTQVHVSSTASPGGWLRAGDFQLLSQGIRNALGSAVLPITLGLLKGQKPDATARYLTHSQGKNEENGECGWAVQILPLCQERKTIPKKSRSSKIHI